MAGCEESKEVMVAKVPPLTYPIRRLVPWALASVLFAVVACLGLWAFFGIPFNLIPPPTDKWPADLPGGFAIWHVWALAAWLALMPFACVVWLTISMVITKGAQTPPWMSKSWHAGSCLIFLAASTWAVVYLRADSLRCLVVFCPGTSGDDHVSAFANWTFLWILLLSVLLASVFGAAALGLGRTSKTRKSLAQRASRRQRQQLCSSAALAVVILPLCFALTTLLPNTFQKFTPGGISSTAALTLYESETPMGKVVPERGDAFLKSFNVVLVQDVVVLKVFPDTLIFYGFLEILAVAALLAAIFPRFGRALGRPCLLKATYGEVFALALLLVALTLWTVYWLHDHNYHDGKPTMDPFASERVARWFGLTAVLFMSLAMLPASKNSLWLRALGISWERGLWLHRGFGAASLFAIALHVVCFWIRWAQLDVFGHDLLRIFGREPGYYPMNGPKAAPNSDNWTIVLMQLIGYPAFFLMGLPPLWRRRNYEAFKYLHYVFLVLIPATLLHAESAWYFMLGGVAFWLVDVALRQTTSFASTPLLSATAHDADTGITELRFKKFFDEPGQYCFINVPALSLWEWHPFSLCSSPSDDAAQMCIKNMGPGTFTGRLFQLAKSQPAGGFVVNVDGPYGPPLDLDGRQAVLLLAGGIGITPMHSTFRTLAQLAAKGELSGLARVDLVWSSRTASLFAVLLESLLECLAALPEDCPQFRVRLFVDPGQSTGVEGADPDLAKLQGRIAAESKVELTLGRPQLDLLAAEAAEAAPSGRTLFQVCGPPGMAAAAESVAVKHANIDFDSQLFVF